MLKYNEMTNMVIKKIGGIVFMTEKFLKLNIEKQSRILRAICEEFTNHSYDDASTNRIVEKAGISKGTLFNYFGCKEDMYHALLRYVLDFFTAYATPDFETDDFIERCRILGEMDMKIYQEAPYMVNFFATIYSGSGSHVPTDITETISILLSEAIEKLYKNVNYSLFRTDVEPTLLMRMIRFTFDGYMKEVFDKMKIGQLTADTFEEFMDDHYTFLKEMEKIYYRREVLTDVEKL